MPRGVGYKRKRGAPYGSRGKRQAMGPYAIVPARRRGYMRVMGRSAGALVAVPERKYFDAELNAKTIPESTDWTGTEIDPDTVPVAAINTLFAPVQGNAINNRIGRKVQVLKLSIRGTIHNTVLTDQADAIPLPQVRLVLYQDKQSNGVQAQGEDLMRAPTSASTQTAVATFQSLANFGKFRVLKDKTFTFRDFVGFNDAAATGTMATNQIPFKLNVKFRKPVVVHFNATNGGTIADIVDNSFHMIASAAGSTNWVTNVTYCARTVYVDV